MHHVTPRSDGIHHRQDSFKVTLAIVANSVLSRILCSSKWYVLIFFFYSSVGGTLSIEHLQSSVKKKRENNTCIGAQKGGHNFGH